MASTKRSGPSIPDAQRRTTRVTVHLAPEVAAELRRRGAKHPRGASGVVADLLGESATCGPSAKSAEDCLYYPLEDDSELKF
jgi:hypothetical protein